MNDNSLPKCPEGKIYCFAHVDSGRCRCLNNTDFHGKPCPFYKTAKEAGFAGIGRLLDEASM